MIIDLKRAKRTEEFNKERKKSNLNMGPGGSYDGYDVRDGDSGGRKLSLTIEEGTVPPPLQLPVSSSLPKGFVPPDV